MKGWDRSAALRLGAILLVAVAASASYTVQPGDTLGRIAADVDRSVADLIALNALSDPDLIYPGQVLLTGEEDGAGAPSSPEDAHIVRRGETLAEIARNHGVSVDTLVRANGIVDGRVFVGYRLRLTLPSVEFHPPATLRTHTVRAGESLAAIAHRHGTSVAELLALNDLADPNNIRIGSDLVIQGGWACPVPAGNFSNDWGYVKASGRVHDGIDIFAPRGSEILAPVSGHLHRSTGDVGGKQFILFGDDDVDYFGSHMDGFGARGDVVAGAVIGTVGNTGNASGTQPHLHFETHPGGGVSANPYPTLLAACG